MKRCQKEDLNTAEWYDRFHFSERGDREGNPCGDVALLMPVLTRDALTMLDIGCGRGKYFPYFRAKEIYGIDISPASIADAKVKYPNAHLQTVDVVKQGLPFPDAAFNLVYCGEVIEHLEDPHALVKEIHRVLHPGGVLVLNTPFEDMIPCDVHLWYFDRNDLVGMFKDFKNVSIFRFDNSPERKRWEHFLVIATKE